MVEKNMKCPILLPLTSFYMVIRWYHKNVASHNIQSRSSLPFGGVIQRGKQQLVKRQWVSTCTVKTKGTMKWTNEQMM